MINIVIPMAGLGSRFQRAGYSLPKPLIPIHGVPMIEVVVNNLRPACPHRFIFLCRAEHLVDHDLAQRLSTWAPDCGIIPVGAVTAGAACTVLLARELINNSDPLIIANSDQYVTADIDDFIADIGARSLDGLIMTMIASDPKWSYVGFKADGTVDHVVEKEVVSAHATVGIYGFARGSDFIGAAEEMIASNRRTNGEFYVAPCYSEMVAVGKRIGTYPVGEVGRGMHGLGIPEDLEDFLANPVSMRARSEC